MPLPTTFNPANANFAPFGGLSGMSTQQKEILGGLMVVSAFGMMGVAALVTYGAAAAGPVTLVGVTYQQTINGVVQTSTLVYSSAGTGLTSGQVAGLATARALALGEVAPTTLTPLMQAFGFDRIGTVANLIALGVYNNPTIFNFFGNIGGYLGSFMGSGGFGAGTPPGFPGFPANTVYGNFAGAPGGPVYGCIEVDGTVECFYYY